MTSTVLTTVGSHESEVKKSRFLCRAAPVADPDAALAFLSECADPSASHACWAYRIGRDYRFNDGGEPAGTAGRPILAAIDGQGLDRTMAVVLRWFGGIKLGAGGLARAYGGCAAECLRRAEKSQWMETDSVWLKLDFSDSDVVHRLLAVHGAEKTEERYHADGLRLGLRVPRHRLMALDTALRDATQGRCGLQRTNG